jgi:hypothetical protein
MNFWNRFGTHKDPVHNLLFLGRGRYCFASGKQDGAAEEFTAVSQG